jgi:anti-sigma B factor antagonist
MTISTRQSAGARIVDLAGDVDLRTSPGLRRALFNLLDHTPKLALNLQSIRYIDSAGIAILLEVLKECQRLKTQFVLFGLNPAVKEVLHLTHVQRVFQVFETEEQAVGSA